MANTYNSTSLKALTILLFSSSILCAQSADPNRFLNAKKWTGTFSVSTVVSGSASGSGYTNTWKVAQHSMGTIQFTPEPNVSGSWIGNVIAAVSWNDDFSIVSTDPPCTISWSHHAMFDQTSPGHLRISGGMLTTFSDSSEIYGDIASITTGSCPPTGPYGGLMLAYPEDSFPLPATGMRVQGSRSYPFSFYVPVAAAAVPNATVVTWDFTADAPLPDLIISAAGYENWRPMAGANEKDPGNTLTFTANLQNKDGTTPAVGAKRFTYALNKRSSVKGIAMNYPPESKALSDPDLQIDQRINPLLTVKGDFGQSAVSADGTYTTSPPVVITSYDWGAYGSLNITAEMPDGTKIVGYLQGDNTQTDVRIPKRALDSAIADKWKDDTGMAGKSDLDDSEQTEGGDGHSGDGLSLYEEYRGFYENGKRIEGDPTKKELFVNDKTGDSYGGTQLYEMLTGVRVHPRMLFDEMAYSDIGWVNFNYDPALHVTNQHGLVMYVDPERTGSALTERHQGTPFGTPKTVVDIVFPADLLFQSVFSPGPALTYAAGAQTIAHEMLHASNVSHHGEAKQQVTWTNPVTSGFNSVQAIEDNSSLVTIRLESPEGDSRPPTLKQSSNWRVGIVGGTNSGNQDCVMRYNDANVYDFNFYNDGSNRVLVFPPQPPSVSQPTLCRNISGTGINNPLRLRGFGDSTCGNCFAQFCINDRYDHTQVCP